MPPFLRPSVVCRVTHSPALTVLVASLCLPGCFDGGFRFEDDSGCPPGAQGDCDATAPAVTDARTTDAGGTTETSGLFDTTAGGDSTGARETAGGPTTESDGTTGPDQPDESGESGDTVSTLDGTETDDGPSLAWTMSLLAGPIETMAVSHDGSLVAVTVGQQTAVRVFDGRTGQLLQTFDAYVDTHDPYTISWTEDRYPGYLSFIGNTTSLLVTDRIGIVSIWDARTATRTARYEVSAEGTVLGVMLSPDGKTFVLDQGGGDPQVRRTSDGSLVQTLPFGFRVNDNDLLAPDARSFLATGGVGAFRRFDFDTATSTRIDYDPARGAALGAIYADSGQTLVWRASNMVWATDSQTGVELWSQPVAGYNCLASAFGSSTFSAGDVLYGYNESDACVIDVRDARTGALAARYTTESRTLLASALIPDTGNVLIAKRSNLHTNIRQFNGITPLGGSFATVASGHPDSSLSLRTLSPYRPWLLTGSSFETAVGFWDLESQRFLRSFDFATAPELEWIDSVMWARDARRLVFCAEGAVYFLDLATGSVSGSFAAPEGSSTFALMDLSPDGQSLLMSNRERKAYVRRFDDGFNSAVVYSGHRAPIADLSFSPDGTRAMTCSDDATLAIWNPQTGETLLAVSTGAAVERCVWRSNTEVLSVSANGEVAVWNIETGAPVTRYSLRLNENVRSLSSVISPDGLFVGSISRGRTGEGEAVLHLGTATAPVLTYRLPEAFQYDSLGSVGDGEFVLMGRSVAGFKY